MMEQGESGAVDRWPEPRKTMDAEPFWEGVDANKLLYQHCPSCSQIVWPAHSVCPHCDATGLVWKESAGKGAIYSYSTVMRPPTPIWNEKAPYTVGIIHLDEDYYFFSEIDEPWEEMEVGRRVEVTYIQRDEMRLPIFKFAAA